MLSPARRHLLSNALARLSGSAASQGLTALALLLTARVLGPSPYGQLTAALNLAGLLSAAFNLGFNTWLLREGAVQRERLAQFAGSILLLKLGGGLVWLLLLSWLAPLWPNAEGIPPQLLFWCAAMTLLDSLFVTMIVTCRAALLSWPTLALETASDGLWLLATLALALAGVREPLPYVLVRLATLLLSLGGGLWALRRWLGLGADLALARLALRQTWSYAGSELLWRLAARADVVIVSLYLGSLAAGLYGSAVSIVTALFILPAALYNVLLPALSGRQGQPGAARRLARGGLLAQAAIGLASTALVWLAAPLAIVLLKESFAGALPVLRVLSWLLLLRALSFGLGAVLVAAGRQNQRLVVQALAVALSILANLWVAPRWGIVGVAWVFVASEGLTTLGYAWFAALWQASAPPNGGGA